MPSEAIFWFANVARWIVWDRKAGCTKLFQRNIARASLKDRTATSKALLSQDCSCWRETKRWWTRTRVAISGSKKTNKINIKGSSQSRLLSEGNKNAATGEREQCSQFPDSPPKLLLKQDIISELPWYIHLKRKRIPNLRRQQKYWKCKTYTYFKNLNI